VDASVCVWDSYETLAHPCYISLPAASRNPRIHSRATYTVGGNDDGHLAQSAHDRSMSPSFPPCGGLLLGCTATTVRRFTPLPPIPVIPSMLLCAQRTASHHAAAPFFVRPCRRCPNSSPVPLVLLPPSRRKRERRRRNKRLEEVVKKEQEEEGESGSGKKWREREVPMSRPRRSFCFSPPEISASFHAGVITPSSFFSPLPSRVDYSFFFTFFSLLFSFPRERKFRILCRARSLPTRDEGGGRAMTSVADFRLKCSHLESVFSCMEPVDIFSQQQTSRLSEFSAIFGRIRNFSLVSFIGECAQKSSDHPLFF